MDELNNIELLRYLNGELSEHEKVSFEKRLSQDSDLQKELEVYKQLIEGVKTSERNKMKASIAAIGAGIGATSLTTYSPKIPPGGGGGVSFIGKAIKLFLTLAIVGGIGSIALIALGKFPIEHPAVDVIHEKIMQYEQTVIIDTVYQTIESDQITGDTVFYGQEEYDNYLKSLEEGQ